MSQPANPSDDTDTPPPPPSRPPAAGPAADEDTQHDTEQPRLAETAELPEEIKAILAKERKARRDAERRVKAAEAQVRDYSDRDKSEAEKAADRIAQLEADTAAARAEAIRWKVITETRLPAELHEFLPTSGEEDELREKAAKLIAALAATKPKTPKPDPAQGARPDGSPGPDAAIADAEAKGDWPTARRLKTYKLIGG